MASGEGGGGGGGGAGPLEKRKKSEGGITFVLQGLHSISSGLADSPMIMPEYTGHCAPTKSVPRDCTPSSAYVVVTPSAMEMMAPFRAV
jgi:hypothetical protein